MNENGFCGKIKYEINEDEVRFMKREARVKAMQLLYSIDVLGITYEEALVEEEDLDVLAGDYAKYCYQHLQQIDDIITHSLKNYTIDRLNLVDKAIIRLAVSEMLEGSQPKEVIINEALEITKEYSDQGDHKAVSFNNRLLDNIKNALQ